MEGGFITSLYLKTKPLSIPSHFQIIIQRCLPILSTSNEMNKANKRIVNIPATKDNQYWLLHSLTISNNINRTNKSTINKLSRISDGV